MKKKILSIILIIAFIMASSLVSFATNQSQDSKNERWFNKATNF